MAAFTITAAAAQTAGRRQVIGLTSHPRRSGTGEAIAEGLVSASQQLVGALGALDPRRPSGSDPGGLLRSMVGHGRGGIDRVELLARRG